MEHILPEVRGGVVLEPACGRGYMARPLGEYFSVVHASDICDYGYGDVRDFTDESYQPEVDWVITNPPFKAAELFIDRGLSIAQNGVAVFVRTVFLESIGRYNRLFKDKPCDVFAQFAERVPLVKGRVDPLATTATGYCWLIWRKNSRNPPQLSWIPPTRRRLERAGDYEHVASAPSPRKSVQAAFF